MKITYTYIYFSINSGTIKQHIRRHHHIQNVDNYIYKSARKAKAKRSNDSTSVSDQPDHLFRCHICAVQFSEKCNLIRHVRRKHTDIVALFESDGAHVSLSTGAAGGDKQAKLVDELVEKQGEEKQDDPSSNQHNTQLIESNAESSDIESREEHADPLHCRHEGCDLKVAASMFDQVSKNVLDKPLQPSSSNHNNTQSRNSEKDYGDSEILLEDTSSNEDKLYDVDFLYKIGLTHSRKSKEITPEEVTLNTKDICMNYYSVSTTDKKEWELIKKEQHYIKELPSKPVYLDESNTIEKITQDTRFSESSTIKCNIDEVAARENTSKHNNMTSHLDHQKNYIKEIDRKVDDVCRRSQVPLHNVDEPGINTLTEQSMNKDSEANQICLQETFPKIRNGDSKVSILFYYMDVCGL